MKAAQQPAYSIACPLNAIHPELRQTHPYTHIHAYTYTHTRTHTHTHTHTHTRTHTTHKQHTPRWPSLWVPTPRRSFSPPVPPRATTWPLRVWHSSTRKRKSTSSPRRQSTSVCWTRAGAIRVCVSVCVLAFIVCFMCCSCHLCVCFVCHCVMKCSDLCRCAKSLNARRCLCHLPVGVHHTHITQTHRAKTHVHMHARSTCTRKNTETRTRKHTKRAHSLAHAHANTHTHTQVAAATRL